MAADDPAELDDIAALIATHRRLYLTATWTGQRAAAEWHRRVVDDLIRTQQIDPDPPVRRLSWDY